MPVIRWISVERSCGCDWPDLQVDRTVRMSGAWIGCDAVHLNLGTPGDVAQRDQSSDFFKGLRCVWVVIWCGKPYCILLNQRFRSKHY